MVVFAETDADVLEPGVETAEFAFVELDSLALQLIFLDSIMFAKNGGGAKFFLLKVKPSTRNKYDR